jgi:hypothetical protein
LTHESGWSLSAFPSGRLVWEDVESDLEPRHMNGVARERVLVLWRALAAGDFGEVERNEWRDGYGDEPSA